MTRVLITGVSGSIGKHLAGELSTLEEVSGVTGIDTEPLDLVAPNLSFVCEDLNTCDLPSMLRNIDVVVHTALSSGPQTLGHLLRACSDASVLQFVLVSSAAVYGTWQVNQFPTSEDAPLRPDIGSADGVACAELERVASAFFDNQTSVVLTILRLASLTGTSKLDEQVRDLMSNADWETSKPMQYLHVNDAARALSLSIEKRLGGVYNVGADFVSVTQARALSGLRPRKPSGQRSSSTRQPWVVASDKLIAQEWRPQYSSSEALVGAMRPAGWERMSPGQRRVLVSASVVAVPTATLAGVLGVVGTLLLKSRRKGRRSRWR